MRTIAGTFDSPESGMKAFKRLAALIGKRCVHVLVPGESRAQIKAVPTTQDMPPILRYMSAVIGAVLGFGFGFVLPSPYAFGLAIVLAGAGAVAGWKLGDLLDRAGSTGLPADALYVYEDAVRQGRTVLVALVERKENEAEVIRAMEEEHAETVNPAGEGDWQVGLVDATEARYQPPEEENSNR